MKYTLTLALLLLAATGRGGQTQTNQVMLRLEKLEDSMRGETNDLTSRIEPLECYQMTSAVYVAKSITIGPVEICCTNGAVTIDKGITLDAASREFWKALEEAYKGMFPANDIRKLAASGEICKVFGFHCWGTDWLSAVQLVYYPDGQPQSRKCRICGKIETYKGEWK